MNDSAITGQKGEDVAATFLQKQGYEVVERNWRTGSLEIDLIARKNDMLIFVEVKTRSVRPLVEAARAVNRTKQKTLLRAAGLYLQINKCTQEARFDIITVEKEGEKVLEHIESAYHSYAR